MAKKSKTRGERTTVVLPLVLARNLKIFISLDSRRRSMTRIMADALDAYLKEELKGYVGDSFCVSKDSLSKVVLENIKKRVGMK